MLTMLVEKVGGHPLAEYRARIFRPLALTETYLADSVRFTGPHMSSYEAGPGRALAAVTDDLSLGAAGSGALVSTAADLVTFPRAARWSPVAPSLLGQMTTASPDSAMSTAMDGYGLGLTRYVTSCGAVAWGHGGAIGGHVTDVHASPDGRTVACCRERRRTTDVRDTVTGALLCRAGRAR